MEVVILRLAMNRAESDRLQEVCAQIAVEKDRAKFMELVTELNRLLSSSPEPLRQEERDKKVASDEEK
jgi:hypothetical protein